MDKKILVALVIFITVSVFVIGLGMIYKNFWENNLKKQAAKDYFDSKLKEDPKLLYSDIEALAAQYFDLKRKQDEGEDAFIKRFAQYIGYPLPQDTDFSKLK